MQDPLGVRLVAIQSMRDLDIGSMVVNVNGYASAMGHRQHPAPARTNQRSLHNCCLLCPAHHQQVHLQGWDITIRGGRVEFTTPAIINPDRRPLTNPLRH